MKEKAKGKDSFYYAWFNITDENYCMYNWSNEELDKLDDDTIKGILIKIRLCFRILK